jgi:DNA-binding NarL/FixJ family response regulator
VGRGAPRAPRGGHESIEGLRGEQEASKMKRTGKKGRRRIALVDDDPAVLASLEAGLGRQFDIVAKCASGEEALNVFSDLPRNRRPHLVLLDIKMPGMDGIECCRKLRSEFPELVIAMHTAKSVRECFENALRAGADAFIVKGVAIEQLARTLGELKRQPIEECRCLAAAPAANEALKTVDVLTNREIELMDYVSQGFSYKQAADHFGCSESNIKKTVARAIRHLTARSKDHAIRLWLERG